MWCCILEGGTLGNYKLVDVCRVVCVFCRKPSGVQRIENTLIPSSQSSLPRCRFVRYKIGLASHILYHQQDREVRMGNRVGLLRRDAGWETDSKKCRERWQSFIYIIPTTTER